MVSPSSKYNKVSTLLFHKFVGVNAAVINCMSHFYMFVPTKSTVKLDNGNTGHSQGIGIILCSFPDCSNIYTVGPVYYCPGHPSNNIFLGELNFLLLFKRLKLNLLTIVTLLTFKIILGENPIRLKKYIYFLQIGF